MTLEEKNLNRFKSEIDFLLSDCQIILYRLIFKEFKMADIESSKDKLEDYKKALSCYKIQFKTINSLGENYETKHILKYVILIAINFFIRCNRDRFDKEMFFVYIVSRVINLVAQDDIKEILDEKSFEIGEISNIIYNNYERKISKL